MVPVSGWNGARTAPDWNSDCEWACTTAPVAAVAPLPGRRVATPSATGDDVISPRSGAERTRTVVPAGVSLVLLETRQTGLPGRETCILCAGTEPVCPVSVSGVGSTGRSNSNSSSNSSGGSSLCVCRW